MPSNRPRPVPSTRGLSLLEVLVAAVILTVALMAVVALRVQNQRRLVVSHLHLQAQLWARQVIGTLVTRPYDQIETLRRAAPGSIPVPPGPAGFPGGLTVRVEDADGDPPQALSRIVRIVVTVSWSPYGTGVSRGRGTFILDRLVAMPESTLVWER